MKICDDTCENCLYICEGDFICEVLNEIVIDEWVPVYGKCIVEERKLNERNRKKNEPGV